MSLTLGREGGIAKPLKKQTVGQINIAHVYDGVNHIRPTSVIHFSDFTSVQLRYIWGSDELFGVYIDGRNRTDALIEKNNTDHFNLYKYTRDADDDIRKELSDLKAELAVTKAIRPYQDKLIQCEMEKMFTAGINYTDRKTCNVIYGVVTLPNEPTVTGLVGRNACGCLPCGFTQPASGTPAQ